MIQSFTGALLASRYRVGSLLGHGGTSEVYDGVDESLGRPVAIKILRGASSLARFEREARLLARLAHPHVVVMSDFRNADGEPPFIVMERLEGASLGTVLERERAISPRRTARLAQQVLSALAAAHAQGVVHRDLKPDNVFVCRGAGDEGVVKLLDFGIARPLEGATLEALTQSNALLGTVSYMAPEQVLGWPVDARTDIYGLGATMYHALAGRTPFQGTTVEVLTAIATASAPRLEGVDARLAAIVERAMLRDPNARFASAQEMSAAIASGLGAETPAARPSGSLGPWIFASALLVALAAAGASVLVLRRSTASAPPPIVTVATAASSTAASSEAPVTYPSAAPSTSAVPSASGVVLRRVQSPPKSAHEAESEVDATLAVKGDITNDVMQSDLDPASIEYYGCYIREYPSAPYANGAVTLHFDVAAQRPENVTVVSNDFAKPALGACLVRIVSGKVIHHATLGQTADVFYTLRFTTAP